MTHYPVKTVFKLFVLLWSMLCCQWCPPPNRPVIFPDHMKMQNWEARMQTRPLAHGSGRLNLMSFVCIQTLSRIQILRSIKSNYKPSILKFAHSGPWWFNRFVRIFSILTWHHFVKACLLRSKRNQECILNPPSHPFVLLLIKDGCWNEIWSPDLYLCWILIGSDGAQNCRGVEGHNQT